MGRRTLITGGASQLAIELSQRLEADSTTAPPRTQLDVSSAAAVDQLVEQVSPELIVHTAALTAVDACEQRHLDAYRVNVVGAWNVARAAARVGAEMVYLSTNYVFDGQKLGPYLEYDRPAPLNAYGLSKLLGEIAARQVLERLYIVRTSWMYSRWRRNFVTTVMRQAEEEEEIRYVGDQVANPTYARDLAAAVLQLTETGAYGVHHLVNEGATSWYGWAAAVLRAVGRTEVRLEEIAGAEFERPAAIPANSELANETARSVGVTMRPWVEALEEFVREVRR